MFLLSNYGQLEAGKWPAKRTGYIDQVDAGVQRSQFIRTDKPISDIKAELDYRVAKLPKMTRKMLFDIDWERDWYSLSTESRNIVNYLSGWRRKKQAYVQWKASSAWDKSDKKYRLKN